MCSSDLHVAPGSPPVMRSAVPVGYPNVKSNPISTRSSPVVMTSSLSAAIAAARVGIFTGAVAAVSAAWLLGEMLTASQWAGVGLILATGAFVGVAEGRKV